MAAIFIWAIGYLAGVVLISSFLLQQITDLSPSFVHFLSLSRRLGNMVAWDSDWEASEEQDRPSLWTLTDLAEIRPLSRVVNVVNMVS